MKFCIPFVVISIVATANAQVKLVEQRIVNGIAVPADTYQWFTALSMGCGASLIHEDIVISAAHCIWGGGSSFSGFFDGFFDACTTVAKISTSPWTTTSLSSLIDIETNKISDYIHHKEYNSDCFSQNDIMVLKLKTPITDITPIAINEDGNVPATGSTVRVIGIGTTSFGGSLSDNLQYVDLKAIDQDTCNDEWGGTIGTGKMCAKEVDKDSCQGDSGGPLFVDGTSPTLVGLVSYGDGCAFNAYPSPVYTRVSDYADFINSAICCLSANPPSTCASTGADACPSDSYSDTCPNNDRDSASACETVSEDFFCFSYHTTAKVKGKGDSPMSMIKVGDEVLTRSGSYKKVYSIDHHHKTKLVEFLQVYCEEDTNKPLELTANHMIFKAGREHPVPVGTLRAGDQVETHDGNCRVKNISSVIRKGLISPLTTDGTIVASGIVCSIYSSLSVETEWVEWNKNVKLMSFQSFFSSLLQPYKFVCTTLSMDFCKTNEERVMISNAASKMYHIFYDVGLYKVFISFAAVLATLMNFVSFAFFPVISVWAIIARKRKNV